jgi:hypothetical protein
MEQPREALKKLNVFASMPGHSESPGVGSLLALERRALLVLNRRHVFADYAI